MSKIKRSRKDVVIGGVCAGFAKYFGIDPLIVRIIFIFLAIQFYGVLIYLILWAIMEKEPIGGVDMYEASEVKKPKDEEHKN